MKNRNQNKCLISQSWIFYPSFVAKSDCDGNEPAHVAPTNVQLHRAMRAQPFTDKLIRNICRSRFCIFVTQLCVYSLAWRRYVSVYLLLISSDSPKLARSIQTELMKQNVRKEKTIEWWMFSSSSLTIEIWSHSSKGSSNRNCMSLIVGGLGPEKGKMMVARLKLASLDCESAEVFHL